LDKKILILQGTNKMIWRAIKTNRAPLKLIARDDVVQVARYFFNFFPYFSTAWKPRLYAGKSTLAPNMASSPTIGTGANAASINGASFSCAETTLLPYL
jgi:hypothetical protein